jgi:hypothetical protein
MINGRCRMTTQLTESNGVKVRGGECLGKFRVGVCVVEEDLKRGCCNFLSFFILFLENSFLLLPYHLV